PHVDEETMRTHHLAHHAAYTRKINEALEELRADPQLKHLAKLGVDTLLDDQYLEQVPQRLRGKVRNNGGGFVNHDLFWHSMSPNGGGEPAQGSDLAQAMGESFGSFEAWKQAFAEKSMGVFGSGWCWLVVNMANGQLQIVSTPNQDLPRHPVLLGLDLWEHAYYLKHKSARAAYVEAWFNVIDWDQAAKRLTAATKELVELVSLAPLVELDVLGQVHINVGPGALEKALVPVFAPLDLCKLSPRGVALDVPGQLELRHAVSVAHGSVPAVDDAGLGLRGVDTGTCSLDQAVVCLAAVQDGLDGLVAEPALRDAQLHHTRRCGNVPGGGREAGVRGPGALAVAHLVPATSGRCRQLAFAQIQRPGELRESREGHRSLTRQPESGRSRSRWGRTNRPRARAMKRFSQRLFGKGGGGKEASDGSAKSDAQLQSESKRIVLFQGVALVFLSKVRSDVHAGKAARGVELVVADEDLSDDVKAGATIRREGANPDGSSYGEVAYVDGRVHFQDAQVSPKARADWTTEDVTEQHVLPQTFRQRAFMLDKIPPAFVGPLFKGVFVSQARQCRFGDLVAALEHHFRGQDPAKVFVWLDIFSANQHLLTNPDEELADEVVAQRDSLLTSGLHEAIQRFDERLIFFDKWNDPDDAFLKVLLEDANKVTQAVADIDTRKATCFKVGDKAMITREIERTLTQGFVTLNAVILASLRDWLAAITHAAVDKSRATDGRSTEHAKVCNQAGFFCKSQSALEQALRYFEEALEISTETLGDQHQHVATTLNNIAGVHRAQGKYAEALRYYEEALKIRREKLGDRDPSVATTLNNIAIVYEAQNKFDEALRCHKEALGIKKEKLGDRHASVATTLANIAGVYRELGRYDEALRNLDEALEIRREELGDRHPSVATTLNNIARVYGKQGIFDEALKCYEEALEINIEKLGDRHPSVAATLNNIGQLYNSQGKDDEALRYYEEALEIRRVKLVDRHPDVAQTLNCIGWVHRAREGWSAALPFFEEAFAILLETLGADHPDTVSAKSSVEECKQHL
ncbi:Superoxide dismutase [Mn], partial [Durusdinium trenchii]